MCLRELAHIVLNMQVPTFIQGSMNVKSHNMQESITGEL